MIEVELVGAELSRPSAEDVAQSVGGRSSAAVLPSLAEIRRLCARAAGSVGVRDGHLAIEFVDELRMTELNGRYRSSHRPTDVLSFPVDGAEPTSGARELGDVVICPAHTEDVREAIVHGVLHLVGMDHETDEGQMLSLQRELLATGRT
ncbi:MAG TPA: rRNA maturation RNase YbeY [Solirubrobacteraceae bacterium]|nr:rRNA maturation RNase YbeY [Solirubrobacteraceae bacterium]